MGGMRGFALAAAIVAAAASVAGAVGAQESATRARQVYERAVAARGGRQPCGSTLAAVGGVRPGAARPGRAEPAGEALERIGALDAAFDAYRRALAERPAFRKASNNLILALVKTGNGPEAVDRARALVAESPKDPDRYFTLGLAQSEQDVDAAIATFRKVLELSPRHTLARYNLALVLRRADRLPEALAEFERAVATQTRSPKRTTRWVSSTGTREIWTGQCRRISRRVAAEPRYADAYYALGSVLKAKWRPAQAPSTACGERSTLRRILPTAHYTLGLVLQLSGDVPGAPELDQAERLRRRAELEHEALVSTSVGIRKMEEGDLTGALDAVQPRDRGIRRLRPCALPAGPGAAAPRPAGRRPRGIRRAHQLNPSLVPPRELR